MQNARERMFLSYQTNEGLQISTYSIIEVTKFLLQMGMPFVLTDRFNQDVVEEYFGRHRSLGRRNEAPSLYQFGYNSNTIRMQRPVPPVTGNTRGAHKTKRRVSWKYVEEESLKSIKRTNDFVLCKLLCYNYNKTKNKEASKELARNQFSGSTVPQSEILTVLLKFFWNQTKLSLT